MYKKILLTTIPLEHIALTARSNGLRAFVPGTPEDYFLYLNNIEFVNGFTLPNYATQFIKENIPSIDILEYPTWDEYKTAVKAGYDIVAISFWTYTLPYAAEMVRIAREAGVKTVWGGGHGVSTPGAGLLFDRIFKGYAEYELSMILEGKPLAYIKHPLLESAFDFFLEDQRTGYLFTIRGCRMECTFCSGPRYYQRLDITPIEEIERVLDIYQKRGIKHITIVDENFLQKPDHARKVIQSLHRRNLQWGCTSRVDLLQGRIEELKTLGLKNVYIGIESLNPISLKSVKKGDIANKTILLLKELEASGNSFAFGTYIIGLDGDTEAGIMADIEKLNQFRALYGVVFWIATPFPGTDFYDSLDAQGLIFNKDWRDYDALHLVRQHAEISPEKARELLVYCVRNHCHEMNIRKYKMLKQWKKLEEKLIPVKSL